ncbi:hypothetical protein EJ04DRAFT_516682 [Polyplosphaeria fusca]|uniref:Uncharacterized protein n=1 Tax=Polyplosphaeria fusca TaxID=682080 RepID=A0A9P4QNY3_9PLEO|nr:hypothetical protein EJ04DRAFT_516682 [Polyplosphaeria fusca]
MSNGNRDRNEEAKLVLNWWKKSLETFIIVCTFGGSITFSLIMLNIANPSRLNSENLATRARYDVEEVREFLAVGWVLFMCNLGICCLLSGLVYFQELDILGNWPDGRLWWGITWEWLLHICSFVITGLLIAAFAVLSMAVVAYVEPVGWAGLALTMLWGSIVVGCWIYQCFNIWSG